MMHKASLLTSLCLGLTLSAPAFTDSTTTSDVTGPGLQLQASTVAPAVAWQGMRPPDQPPVTDGKYSIYDIKPAVDFPITAVGTAWSLYAFTKIYSKEGSSIEQIQALDKNDIPSFDRWGADVYNERADKISDYPFYVAMPLPLLLLADRTIRNDALRVGFLYLEAMAITGTLYTGAVYFNDRYRPLAYNPEVDMSERTGGGSKNSFFGGHPALVGTSTFFIAKVFHDYHPDSKFRYVLWGTAIAATGATAYLRHAGGKHFPSDLLIGTTIGTLSGILVPHLHKKKLLPDDRMSISPFSMGGTNGLSFVYRFK